MLARTRVRSRTTPRSQSGHSYSLLPTSRQSRRPFSSTSLPAKNRRKIVVLGAGWSAFTFISYINKKEFDVTVVSPRNHFLFTPLLASTTTGTLEFRSIIEPIRSAKHDIQYYQASCTDIDAKSGHIHCQETTEAKTKFSLPYDDLVVAVGADNNTFNVPGVKENAVFLKELHHARAIRSRIIQNFEAASIPGVTPEERRRLLQFVVVGGGPTGVEFAAELADFFWQDLNNYFPEIPTNDVRITLLEAGHNILGAFSQKLVQHAMKTIKKQGVDLRTDNPVKEVKKDSVVLADGTVIPCGLVVWSTGVAPRQLISKSEWTKKSGRLQVDPFLRVQGFQNIYALGDCADGLPATAQVASQHGAYLAQRFNANEHLVETGKPFKFRFLGLMTYIGSYQSIMETPVFQGSGFFEWVAWRSVYLTRLGSFKSKLQVPFNWLKTVVWGRDVTNF